MRAVKPSELMCLLEPEAVARHAANQRLSGGTMELRTSNRIIFGDFLMAAQTSHNGSGLFAQTVIGKFTTARTATV